VPTWTHTPAPGEWVHVIREKIDETQTRVSVVACIGAQAKPAARC
jgi:hypothetical protein